MEAQASDKPTLVLLRSWLMLAGVLLIGAVAYEVHLRSAGWQSTEDAYVKMAQVGISSDVSGRVIRLWVQDNQSVVQGQPLFQLDPARYRLAVDQSRAELEAARMAVRQMQADYQKAVAERDAEKSHLQFAQKEALRQEQLHKAGVASAAQVDHARQEWEAARQALAAREADVQRGRAALNGHPEAAPAAHPSVERARSALERAELELSYTTIRAPADGQVSHVDNLAPGTAIAANTPVFALLLAQQLWIEANFKEDQLTHIVPGQHARVTVDACPGQELPAEVQSLSPGTGSQFSLLPPENASGNWVKVVQRLPVRLVFLQPSKRCALRAGLSVQVRIDTRQITGNGSKLLTIKGGR